jgi:hypothetical protein
MLLWLEEAVIEAAMIVAVTVGVIMFVLATWSALTDWLRPAKGKGAVDETAESPDESRARHHAGSRVA